MPSSLIYFRNLDQQSGDARLRAQWQQLAAASNSSEAIYQTPAFADFLATCAAPQQRFHLYGAYTASHQPLGLIPLLHTGLATRVTRRWYQRQQLVLLGSSPLLPPEPALLDALHDFLLTEFPRVQALVYRALPNNHAIWLHLQQSSTLLPLALHGWRGCHSMTLPSSYAEYLNRLGSKRRYNLKRQQRQLAEAAGGALALQVIRDPADLAALEQGLQLCCPRARRLQLWDRNEMQALARLGLLLCFRIDAGTQCCGVVLGLQSGKVYHLFNILPAPAWQALSAGTSILQLALAYLCDAQGGHCQRVEFGYGQPAHSYQSSNAVSLRSQVLVLRDNPANRLYRLWHGARRALLQRLHRKADVR
ncbi:GNAT family N-acetyltransferase [Pseudoduganella danionis]|uniref:GNAT family N-acetyltransferase n=1 Tax=Pseudoduganella danionis TaxID=1890295 RepID=UPI0035B36ED1